MQFVDSHQQPNEAAALQLEASEMVEQDELWRPCRALSPAMVGAAVGSGVRSVVGSGVAARCGSRRDGTTSSRRTRIYSRAQSASSSRPVFISLLLAFGFI